ncbi:MAG: hypothetical protein H8D94_01935 [Candidatus Pelagibacter sp.]|nr:hypothetical protein [Candidatus Pelagibacter sp.]
MSIYNSSFCNTTTDLKAIVNNIDDYDRKVEITRWQATGSEYVAHNSGYTEVLYLNGEDLGSAQSSENDVDSDKEWYYDQDGDYIVANFSSHPSASIVKGGQDWATLKDTVVKEQAEFIVASLGDFSLLERELSATGRSYDYVLIKMNALLGCGELMRGRDPEEADKLVVKAQEIITGIRKGDISLYSQIQRGTQSGTITESNLAQASNWKILDLRGTFSSNYGYLKVLCTTGGTFNSGSASNIRISTTTGDDDGVFNVDVNTGIIPGSQYESIGNGLFALFSHASGSSDVYTAGDYYVIKGSSLEEDMGEIGILELVAR